MLAPRSRLAFRVPVLAVLLLLGGPPSAASQEDVAGREGYLEPPEPIAEAVLAPWHRSAELEHPSPDGRFFLVETRDRRMPPLSLLAREHLHLGGLQVDPAANRVRDLTTGAPDGFRVVSTDGGPEVPIQVPEGAKVSAPRWSPDASRVAFFVHLDDASHIYVADPASGRARRITDRPALVTLARSFDWSGDGGSVYAVLVPEDRGPAPAEPAVPPTPRIDLTADAENELRTFPDLLETPHERALLEYYGTGQLVEIDVESGRSRAVGEPGLIEEVDVSPDGRHLRVRTVEKPFSGIVPVYRFARLEQVWDAGGEALAQVETEPVRDGADEDEEEGRRAIGWRPDGSGIGFLEREPKPEEDDSTDAGDDADADSEEDEDEASEDRRDRVLQWTPPFAENAPRVLYETEHRLDDLRYSPDADVIFFRERDTENDEERWVALSVEDDTAYTLARHDTEDPYDDPGDLVVRPASPEAPVVRVSPDGRHVYLSGAVYHEDPVADAPQPFLDRVEIAGGETSRIFQSPEDRYEEVRAVLDDEARRIVVSRESPTDPPDYFVLEPGGDDERALTRNRDHWPDITGARREALWAERADGTRFKVEVTLPPGYAGEEPLPALFWHYPREYEDEETYHESLHDFNVNAFPSTSVRSPEILVTLGYAVVDPDVPILGPDERWNDRYVVDLRNTFAAAIDAVAARGWIDRGRLAVGGHSYGGFGTINAMIQTPFFRAGIAGAANSNRSLTPAGFQNEPRTLWEARETYMRMSPLFWMNELTGALLLYHGLDDQNVGTFPDHSVRSFHALNALGKTAALYMYPYEEHGPDARETILDLWARWTAWLDRHVKDPGEEAASEAVADEGSGGG